MNKKLKKNSFHYLTKAVFFILILFLFSCKNFRKKNFLPDNDYAVFFKIENFENYKKISVKNDFNQLKIYILTKDKTSIPDSLKNKNTIIKIPIKSAVYLSTTFLGFVEALNERQTVRGIDNGKYIYDRKISAMWKHGKVVELGQVSATNVEKIIELNPDVVFVNDFDIQVNKFAEKLAKFNIPVIIVHEYRELQPLGRAEWIKFFGEFFDKEKEADSIFLEIKKHYKKISQLKKTEKPGILVNIPFRGVWYLPGGNSYFAHLISDAGGNYLWKNNPDYKSFIVSMEEVLSKKDSVDIWLNTGQATNIKTILQSDKSMDLLFENETIKIYNNNKRLNKYGGNDFWESGVVRPDLVLHDLFYIFHHKKINPDSLVYYQPVAE